MAVPRKMRSGPEKKKMKNKSIAKPNCSSMACISILIGKIVNSTLEPSIGGIGSKLKKAKKTLMITMIIRIS